MPRRGTSFPNRITDCSKLPKTLCFRGFSCSCAVLLVRLLSHKKNWEGRRTRFMGKTTHESYTSLRQHDVMPQVSIEISNIIEFAIKTIDNKSAAVYTWIEQAFEYI